MKNILIVDDNQDVANLVKLMVELSGNKATTVNSGKEALRFISSEKFDLILLDVAMPDITGFDVLKKVKSDPRLAHNKIVFITASSPGDEIIQTLLNHGALQVLKKPINEKVLLDTIAKYT